MIRIELDAEPGREGRARPGHGALVLEVGARVELETGADVVEVGAVDDVVTLPLPLAVALLGGVLTVGLVEMGRVRKITTRITVAASTASTVATAIWISRGVRTGAPFASRRCGRRVLLTRSLLCCTHLLRILPMRIDPS